MLEEMSLKNFTVFSDVTLKFSSGLNVIIGGNGSGKSHLLKLAYSVISASFQEAKRNQGSDSLPSKALMQKVYADKLIQVFRPETLGRLVKRKQGRDNCELNFKFSDDALNCSFSFSTVSKTEVKIEILNKNWQSEAPSFIPTREILSIFPGFLALYSQRYLEFDETYRDMCELLSIPILKGPKAAEVNNLLSVLEDAMGGKVILDKNGRFYLKIANQGEMEITLVAEGLRKLAMLARLISTGSLLDKGYLFWDEPESNLNPKLIRVIAKVIFMLCKNGIQVFIATHSLFLLRELELLSKENDFENVKHTYFSLIRDDFNTVIESAEQAYYLDGIISLDEELSQTERYLQ